MRILHTSDWHLGKSLYDFSLLDDQQYMLDGLLSLLASERVDAVVIAGDLYDRPVPSAAAVQLYDYFLSQAVGKLGIPVLAIAGNHDSASRLEFGSSLYASSGYHICGRVRAEVLRVTLPDVHGPVDFWLLPWLYPADVRSLFPQETVRTFDDAYHVLLDAAAAAFDDSRRHVAVAHGFFSPLGQHAQKPLLTSDSEVNIGGMDIVDSSYFSRFDYTALGHLHAPQRAGSDTARYSGSPLPYSLSEQTQHKSWTLIELGAEGVADISLLPVDCLRRVRTVEGTLAQLLEPSYHQNKAFDDYVFANLSEDGVLYPMEKLRRLFPHLLGLRVCSGADDDAGPVAKLGHSRPRLSPEELFARFYQEMRGHDMPADASIFLHETWEMAKEVEGEQ